MLKLIFSIYKCSSLQSKLALNMTHIAKRDGQLIHSKLADFQQLRETSGAFYGHIRDTQVKSHIKSNIEVFSQSLCKQSSHCYRSQK